MSWKLSKFKTSLDTRDCSNTVSTLTFCQRFIIAVLKMSLLKTFISVIVIENTSYLTGTDMCKNITISI